MQQAGVASRELIEALIRDYDNSFLTLEDVIKQAYHIGSSDTLRRLKS